MSLSAASAQCFDMACNYGPILLIVSWLLVFSSLIAVLARLGTRWSIARRFRWDDALIVFALLFSIGQTGAVSAQVVNGLGQHSKTLPSYKLVAFQRGSQAANICFLISQCLTQISLFSLIQNLSPTLTHLRILQFTSMISILWAISFTIVEVFKCQAPYFWQFIGNQCIDRPMYMIIVYTVDSGINAAFVIMPVWAVLQMHVRSRDKAILATCFSSRLLVIGSSIATIYFIHTTNATFDTTYDYWPVKLSTQIVQCLSIVTACVPFLKPCLELLDSSISGVAELRRRMIAGTCNSSCDGFGNVDDEVLSSGRKRGMIAKIGSVPALPSLPSLFAGRESGEIGDDDDDGAGREESMVGEREQGGKESRRESRKQSRRGSRRESKRESKSRPGYIHRNTSVVESSSRARENGREEMEAMPAGESTTSPVGFIKQTTSFSVERGDDRAGALLPLGLLKY